MLGDLPLLWDLQPLEVQVPLAHFWFMTAPFMSIGELGRRTSRKVQTIRWYEEVGCYLLRPARVEGIALTRSRISSASI